MMEKVAEGNHHNALYDMGERRMGTGEGNGFQGRKERSKGGREGGRKEEV